MTTFMYFTLQHVYNMHFKGGEVKCKECDKLIKNKWYLRRHMVVISSTLLKKDLDLQK